MRSHSLEKSKRMVEYHNNWVTQMVVGTFLPDDFSYHVSPRSGVSDVSHWVQSKKRGPRQPGGT